MPGPDAGTAEEAFCRALARLRCAYLERRDDLAAQHRITAARASELDMRRED